MGLRVNGLKTAQELRWRESAGSMGLRILFLRSRISIQRGLALKLWICCLSCLMIDL